MGTFLLDPSDIQFDLQDGKKIELGAGAFGTVYKGIPPPPPPKKNNSHHQSTFPQRGGVSRVTTQVIYIGIQGKCFGTVEAAIKQITYKGHGNYENFKQEARMMKYSIPLIL